MHTTIALYILISLIKSIDGTFVCTHDGMFENPNDRHSFWHCAHGTNFLKHCPTTLVWSQTVQQCVWNVEPVITVTASSLPPTTIITSTETVSTTTSMPSYLPSQCLNYMSITDGTRRTNNTNLDSETDRSYFSSTPTWVRFEGAAGTRLADYVPSSNRCGAEGAGWVKHGTDPSIGETENQPACFSWGGMSCIWPVKIPMTNCDGYFVYGLVAPSLSSARYCTM